MGGGGGEVERGMRNLEYIWIFFVVRKSCIFLVPLNLDSVDPALQWWRTRYKS